MPQDPGGVLILLVARDHRHRCVRDGACLSELGCLVYMAKRCAHLIHRPQRRTDRTG